MMRKLLLIILLLLACSITLAQYNEKDILAQQAYQLLARRQFTEAEAIFIQILEKFPNDVNSVVQLLQIYFQTSQLDKAESTLNRYRNVLPELSAEEQTIQLFVMQGLPAQAWSLSMTHLQKQRHDIHRYRIIASYFERRGFYEQVLDLYRQARIQHSNDTLFMLEIANTALNFRLFGMALTEYLRFLEANPTNIYHINNQCKIIMAQDSTMINVIGEYANASGNAAVKELYANSLLSMGRQKLALSVYKQLPWDKLHRFAEDQFIALVDETAYPAYAHLIEITQDKIRRAEYLYRMAQIDFRNNRFAGCDSLLLRIIDDPTLVERQYRNRSQINFNARKLMAQNVLAADKDLLAGMRWYQEAQGFARNQSESQDIELEITRLLLINGEYMNAMDKLHSVTEPQLVETRDFLTYLSRLMQKQIDAADSLMNEYIIRYPAGKYVNDSIYLMMFMLDFSEAQMDTFFAAYKKMQLHDPLSVDLLLALFETNNDEELRILAVEWAIALSDKSRALEILDYPWEDEIALEYAALLKLLLMQDGNERIRLARDFLTQNPNSIFSPNFRQRLTSREYSKPKL